MNLIFHERVESGDPLCPRTLTVRGSKWFFV